jgi:hypothetical protein
MKIAQKFEQNSSKTVSKIKTEKNSLLTARQPGPRPAAMRRSAGG